jgi:hypothetical protein
MLVQALGSRHTASHSALLVEATCAACLSKLTKRAIFRPSALPDVSHPRAPTAFTRVFGYDSAARQSAACNTSYPVLAVHMRSRVVPEMNVNHPGDVQRRYPVRPYTEVLFKIMPTSAALPRV